MPRLRRAARQPAGQVFTQEVTYAQKKTSCDVHNGPDVVVAVRLMNRRTR
jgi:hypothetical protein